MGGLSHVAMLAVVGTIAGFAVGSAMKGKNEQHGQKAVATAVTVPDVESGTVVHFAGPLAALSVEGEELPGSILEKKAPGSLVAPDRKIGVASYGGLVEATPAQVELEAYARTLNPIVGYYDPLNLAKQDFWEQGNEATIGFLRHAEIKHGRVAMAGFVGYLVHANGIHFPWKIPGDELCAPGVNPALLWDNLPYEAKLQIILAIGIFEFYSEGAMSLSPGQGGHYMRGGKPGMFPPFKGDAKGCLGDAE